MIDSLEQPRWRRRVLEDIHSSSVAEIVLLIKNNGLSDSSRDGLGTRLWQKRKTLLYDFYTRVDDLIFKFDPDPFESVDVTDLVGNCPSVNVTPIMKKSSDYFSDEDVEAILEYNLDVVLRFGFRILRGRVLQIARHGIWSYHHGDNLINRGSPPGFWEVMNDEPTTGTVLQVLTEELDNGNIIYRSWAPTVDKLSVKRNRGNYYWKSADFVVRNLRELYESNGEGLAYLNEQCPFMPYSHRLYKVPTNRQMAPLLLKLAARSTSALFQKLSSFEQWFLAYRMKKTPDDPNNAFYRFKHIIPPKDRFWADPFPVKFRDRYYIFLEEYLYEQGKAHISVIEFNDHGVPGEPVKVLERDYHLAYPFIFEWQGEHYMIPDSGDNKRVELYRSSEFPWKWEFVKVLLQNHNPVDATLVQWQGRWWMFVSISPYGIPRNWDELHLFYADSPLGPWTPHRRNPVKSDVRSSRPAGRLFWWNNELYRPAQDCSKCYGYGISLNRVKELSPESFAEEQVAKIVPNWDERIIGTHTYNTCENMTVIDCLMRRKKMF